MAEPSLNHWDPAGSTPSPIRLWPSFPLPLYHAGAALAVPYQAISTNSPKPGLTEHRKARWTAETVQVGTEERMGERGLSFCWQHVSFVSSNHIFMGTEDSKNGAVSTFGFVLSANSFANSSSEW